MTEREAIRFPEYGDGGDEAGARRKRRAFRLIVISCLVFTAALWVADQHFRYSQTERLYRMALTLPAPSARAVLRQAVKMDAEAHQHPSPKYLVALAEREEADLILPTYRQAYTLDPRDPAIAMRYGCRLFLEGRAKEARDVFHEAAASAPRNALPSYLEAATLPWIEEAKNEPTESLALVARTNNSEHKVMFPSPLWAPDLPIDGVWYAELRRQIVDECCAPLYQYAARLLETAKPDIEQGRVHQWDSWLETLQNMGERILAGGDPGVAQAQAGVQIQLEAVRQRERISEIRKGKPDERLTARRQKLEQAMGMLKSFEEERTREIEQDRSKYYFPWKICREAFGMLLAVYAMSCLLGWIGRVPKKSWSLPHATVGYAVFAGAFAFLLGVLMSVVVLQRTAGATDTWFTGTSYVWRVGLLLLLVHGLVYPRWTLPSAKRVSERRGNLDETARAARRSYRGAYLAFLRRYAGILVGVFLCALSLWVVAYRIATSLYPWQISLLTTGLAGREVDLVHRVVSLLS